ncbi:tyrosine--tRNA ligase [Candidatus Gottesmanbacteria bacterium RIFCSPHIGHO2_02_FULL_40_24]|nr:MAG: tyrosine--tRNA ligase [Candidatus Gottesmanbacteria bacterium RIFCSPHIGHO2_02_FULL_40_24]
MDQIDQVLTRGVEKIFPSKTALEKVLRSGRKIRLYQGFDPTGDKLHIGHLVGLMKLRQFQDLGHEVIFLIGDGTGMAGDPSGRVKQREGFLTRNELRENAKDYILQADRIVRFSGINAAKILYNGDWLTKLTFTELLELFGRFSIQQLIERDIFQKRIKENKPVNLRESIYPILQGYDSVAMDVDLEIGGTDQTFNMLTGRQLVREILHKEKYILTLPLLADRKGTKIGKTEGNIIALKDKPENLYGQIMNLPDDVIIKCFILITYLPLDEISIIEKELNQGKNPMLLKKRLAYELTRILNNEEAASNAQKVFVSLFQKKSYSVTVPEVKISKEKILIIDLLTKLDLAGSKSQAKILVKSGAVDLNGNTISDPFFSVNPVNDMIIKVGKHKFVKLKV